MIIDLHTHSYYSPDGKLSIPELLNFYSAGDIVGLTDHETIGGWKEFKKDASNRGIKPVFGIEWFLKDYHILSYFTSDVPNSFTDFMVERRLKEKCCMVAIYNKVKANSTSIPSYDKILDLKIHPEKILGMTALSIAVSKASGKNYNEALCMLREERRKLPECDIPMTFYPTDIINKINEWNAVSVLAHPYKNSHLREGRKEKKDVENKVRELAAIGIKGVELYSEGSNMEELYHLLALADELGLNVSVGSDYHDKDKGLKPLELEKLDDKVKFEVKKWLNL